ncbi:hypothetical protein RCJ22_34910 [Vibrio sp. FNV 38]|nr:hypothetical protein [Vibrio sp. FNV 38]
MMTFKTFDRVWAMHNAVSSQTHFKPMLKCNVKYVFARPIFAK